MNQSHFFKQIFFLGLCISIVSCEGYAVAYIFSNGIQERLPNNSIWIYEKFRFEATVQMNSYTRKMYSQMEMLKNLSELGSQTLMKPEYQGEIDFQRSALPQNFWIQDKQIVIMQVDLSKFPSGREELQKYQSLFKHKGTCFYMINTKQANETIPLEIGQIFGFNSSTDPLCQISLQSNTLQENTGLIKECYEKSAKNAVRGSVNISFMYMMSQYGLMALVYIVLTSIITCGSPYMMIWWQRRKDQQLSHV